MRTIEDPFQQILIGTVRQSNRWEKSKLEQSVLVVSPLAENMNKSA
jgi:hypothetical protein